MTRQLDAEYIDIDTEEGYVKFGFTEPKTLDFTAVNKAADDAAYTLKILELRVRGRTLTTACTSCAGDTLALRIPQTGQVLELIGDVPLDRDVLLHASVTGWLGDHPQLEVLGFEETSGE